MAEKWNLRIALASLLTITLLLRIWDFPHRNELRYADELPYCFGSLQLLEGMIPEYKYAPAGPQTWAGWAYAGGVSAWHLVHPSPEERAVPAQLRPFIAVDHALWDNYADLSIVRSIWILVAWPALFWSIIAGFRIGYRQAGLQGGILIGATLSLLPLFMEMSTEARPYMMAWALGIVAIDLATVATTKQRLTFAAVVMGLAIGSRIDMLMILPVIWSELWSRRRQDGFIKPFLRYHIIVAISALVVAPWILTNVVGNLRIIATVRLSTPVGGPVPITKTLTDLFWEQGLGVIIILCIVGLLRRPAEGTNRRWLRSAFILLAIASIFKATNFGLQHQGGPLVIVIALAAAGLAPLVRKDVRIAWIVVVLSLLLPIIQSLQLIHAHHQYYVNDSAVAWLEHHVPAGTPLYEGYWLQTVIPTSQASDRLWAEVNDNNAWEKKFTAGMKRFDISTNDMPRALSDENMLAERGNRRGLFILGSRSNVNRVRFDVHIINAGTIYDVSDPVDEITKHGGVLLWRQFYGITDMPDTSALGAPIASWHGPAGTGVFIYASNDIKGKLKPD